jgi:hypothetical protein
VVNLWPLESSTAKYTGGRKPHYKKRTSAQHACIPPPPSSSSSPLLHTDTIQILPRSCTFALRWFVCCKKWVLLRVGKMSVGLPEAQHLYFRVSLSPMVMRKIKWTDYLRRTTSWNPLCGLKCRFATLQGHQSGQVSVNPSKPG